MLSDGSMGFCFGEIRYFLRESVSQTVLDFVFFSLSALITIPSGSVCMRYLTF